MVRFEKGPRKDDVAHEYLSGFSGAEGIYPIGVAPEKTRTFRTEKRRNPVTGGHATRGSCRPPRWSTTTTATGSTPSSGRSSSSSAPASPIGQVVPQRPPPCAVPRRRGRDRFHPLDNGFAATDDPVRLQRICDRLTGMKIDAFARQVAAAAAAPVHPRVKGQMPAQALRAFPGASQKITMPRPGTLLTEERNGRQRWSAAERILVVNPPRERPEPPVPPENSCHSAAPVGVVGRGTGRAQAAC